MYIDFSSKILRIIRDFTDLVEPFSIDEAFADLTGVIKLWGPPERIASMLKERIQSDFTGIPDRFEPANLERHLEIARWYVDHNYAPQALSMMRELAISVEMYREGQYENVFSRSHRESTAARLHQEGKSTLAGKLWSELGDLRNDVAEKEGQLIKVLVTPLGMSPGLLYTALLQIKPEQVVVVTSAQGKGQLDAVLKKAAFEGVVKVIEVKDPFTAYNEVSLVKEFLIHYLEQLPQCHLYINLTGGTTLLQHMISRLDEVSPENCSQVTMVAMVDRRPSDEQKENPYVLGEMIIIE